MTPDELAKMIPPAALEVGARAVFRVGFDRDPCDDPFDNDRLAFARKYARAAFVVMVEAWEGMHMEDESAPWVPRLILPLAAPSGAITEKQDDA